MTSKIFHHTNVNLDLDPEEFMKLPRNPIYVILDNIRSLHNVGAIFRTCDAALVKKIFLCGLTGTPPRKEITKTALRTVQFVPWEYHQDTTTLLTQLKQEGVRIVSLELCENSQPYTDVRYPFPMALVVGHEIEGVTDTVLSLSDLTVQIPMQGMSNSLNVATATGIALFEITRQWNQRIP